jgi:hypothetical protein
MKLTYRDFKLKDLTLGRIKRIRQNSLILAAVISVFPFVKFAYENFTDFKKNTCIVYACTLVVTVVTLILYDRNVKEHLLLSKAWFWAKALFQVSLLQGSLLLVFVASIFLELFVSQMVSGTLLFCGIIISFIIFYKNLE